jgi:hypothetical protein
MLIFDNNEIKEPSVEILDNTIHFIKPNNKRCMLFKDKEIKIGYYLLTQSEALNFITILYKSLELNHNNPEKELYKYFEKEYGHRTKAELSRIGFDLKSE